MEKMRGNKLYFRTGYVLLFIITTCCMMLSGHALTYEEVRRAKPNGTDSAPYLEQLYIQRSSCIVDAALLSTAFVFDVRYKTMEQENLLALSPACTNDTQLAMSSDLLEIQYAICESLLLPQGIERTKCEELGTNAPSTGRFYGIVWSGSPADIWKKVDAGKTKKPEKASEVFIEEKRNPMSLLRSRLHQEKKDYIQALEKIQNSFVTSGEITSVVLQGKSLDQASMQAQLSVIGSLEWFQQFYFAYPQHKLYLSLVDTMQSTMEVVHSIARIFEQLRYTLPNSSIDGDRNK